MLLFFFGLAKCFDTIDGILLTKLEKYGVKKNALKLFNSYLDGRSQILRIRCAFSDERPITTGVPEGSVLGPLLFLALLDCVSRATVVAQASVVRPSVRRA